MNRKEARKAIFEHFGLEHQIDKLVEELYELIEAICIAKEKYPDDPIKVLHDPDVVDESGDVDVVMKQLRENNQDFQLGMDASEVVKEFRTIDRMEIGYYEES